MRTSIQLRYSRHIRIFFPIALLSEALNRAVWPFFCFLIAT